MAQQLGLRRRPSRPRGPGARRSCPMRSMCRPVSASRHSTRHAEALEDLHLGLAQLARCARARAPRAAGCRASTRVPGAALGELAPGDGRRPRRRPARTSGGTTVHDQPAVERELRADQEQAARRPAPPARRRAPGSAGRQRAATSASRASRISPSAGGAPRSGSAVHGSPDRVRLHLGAGHQLAAADRRGVHVAQRRRRGADHHDAAAEGAGCEIAREEVGERDGGHRARRAAVVDPGAAVDEGAAGTAGAPARSRSTTAIDSSPPSVAREVRHRAGAVVVQVGGAGAGVHARRRLASPPSTLVPPAAVGLARGQHRAAGRRRSRGTAPGPPRGVVGSVNWTS